MALQASFSEPLTKVGTKYIQDPNSFQAGKIFPMCPVNRMSATFPTYDKAYWMKNEAKIRVPGTESSGGTHARGTDSYSCVDVSYHEDIAFENIENDPTPLNPERAATLRVTQKIAIYDELNFADNFFTTGKWGTDLAVSNEWNATGSTPIAEVITGRSTVKLATGFDPNTGVIARGSYDALKTNADILDRIKYTSKENVTLDMLARMFELDRLILLNSVYDSAAYGAAASQAFIGGSDGMLLIYTPETPSLEMPSAGYNFVWTGYGTNGYGVRRFWRDEPMAWRVEAHHYHDMKQTASDLGYFIYSTLT